MTAQGAIEAEWMRAPTYAWCQVSRATTERAEAPPQSHSHVQPPPGRRVTRGWWCARSGWIRRRVVVVIEVPFLVEGFAAPRPLDVLTDDDAAGGPRVCARGDTPDVPHGHASGQASAERRVP